MVEMVNSILYILSQLIEERERDGEPRGLEQEGIKIEKQ
jgi:hypothetical protein